MNLLLWNLLLALVWSMAMGQITEATFLAGFVIGYPVLWIARRALGPSPYFTKVPQVIGFACFYLRELVRSNLRVARDVISPRPRMRPGVLALPIDARNEAEITLLANLITLTPGTLSLDLSPDQKILYIHVMYMEDDLDEMRRAFKADFERRVLEVLR